MAAKYPESGPARRPEVQSSRDGTAAEAALLGRAGQGDDAAFRALVAQHLGAVLATARGILKDEAEAEDVAQDAMLRLWRSAASLELGPGGVRPWLRRVTANLCIDRVRGGRRTIVTDEPPEQSTPAAQMTALAEAETSLRVRSALDGLPERQRLALTLFHYEGMSQTEVGALLGVSEEAVESLLARARRALKAELRDEWRQLLSDTDN